MNVVEQNFNSITELLTYVESKPNNAVFGSKQQSEHGDYNFTKTHSYKEARELLTGGWSEGATKLTSQLKIANAKKQNDEVQRAIFDVVGFQASVPRYLQGIPTNMVNKVRVKQKQKIVTLVKAITYSAGVSATRIMEDSVKFLQIVQAVEKAGFRVNVYTIFYSKANHQHFVSRCKIKSANERLNISKMAFPLMHPSFLRRVLFKLMETEPKLTDEGFKWGYGTPGDNTNTQKMLKKGEYFIPILISESKALEVIAQTTK